MLRPTDTERLASLTAPAEPYVEGEAGPQAAALKGVFQLLTVRLESLRGLQLRNKTQRVRGCGECWQKARSLACWPVGTMPGLSGQVNALFSPTTMSFSKAQCHLSANRGSLQRKGGGEPLLFNPPPLGLGSPICS